MEQIMADLPYQQEAEQHIPHQHQLQAPDSVAPQRLRQVALAEAALEAHLQHQQALVAVQALERERLQLKQS
jgi:hypothetical protein